MLHEINIVTRKFFMPKQNSWCKNDLTDGKHDTRSTYIELLRGETRRSIEMECAIIVSDGTFMLKMKVKWK